MDFAANISMITTSALVTYTAMRKDDGKWLEMGNLGTFMILLFVNFIVRFFFAELLGDLPFRIQNIISRHGYILRSTLD